MDVADSSSQNNGDTITMDLELGENESKQDINGGKGLPPHIPPHLLGRDLDNPMEDQKTTGRRVSMPRMGVKVPYRNLTSQIVTQDEIAQELYERANKRYSEPVSEEVIKALKSLSRNGESDKLVGRILSQAKEGSGSNSGNGEDIKNVNVPAIDVSYAPNTSLTIAKKESTLPKRSSTHSENEMDDETLLAILEGRHEDDKTPQRSRDSVKTNKNRGKRPKPNLDPEVERQLALKQLREFEKNRRTSHKLTFSVLEHEKKLGIEENSDNETSKPVKLLRKNLVKKLRVRENEAPKILSKRYQRVIKQQQRNNKKKICGSSGDTTEPSTSGTRNSSSLPEVPEVKIAIDNYIRSKKRNLTPVVKSEEGEEEEEEVDDEEENEDSDDSVEYEEIIVLPEPTSSSSSSKKAQASTSQSAAVSSRAARSTARAMNNSRSLPDVPIDGSAAQGESANAVSNSEADIKKQKKVMREINRLLGDEGAVDMLYSLEQKRTPGGSQHPPLLSSVRRKKKDLLLKTKVAKNAVLSSLKISIGSSASEDAGRRNKKVGTPDKPKTEVESPPRKDSVDSNISTNSEDKYNDDEQTSSAEASKIIRRRSSSDYGDILSDTEIVTVFNNDDGGDAKTFSKNKKIKSTDSPSGAKKGKVGNKSGETKSSSSDVPVKSENIDTFDRMIQKLTDEVSDIVDGKGHCSDSDSSSTNTYEELVIKRYEKLANIVVTPKSIKLKSSFNKKVLLELVMALREVKSDENINTILLTTTGSTFCQGLDFSELVHDDKTERMNITAECLIALTTFVMELVTCVKPLITGVHGAAVGLGVTMLPYFDLVYSSDKSTFQTPYAKMAHVPEAGATMMLPRISRALANELLLGGRILTAMEAQQYGLVSRIIFHDKFDSELVPVCKGISRQSIQAMNATKGLLAKDFYNDLRSKLKAESIQLFKDWNSEECQNKFRESFHLIDH